MAERQNTVLGQFDEHPKVEPPAVAELHPSLLLHLVRPVSRDEVHVPLTQLVLLLLDQLPVVEDGEKREQQPSVFVVRHPPAIVALA